MRNPLWVWSGDLDLGDVPRLRLEWRALVETGAPAVVADLAAVTFLDCAALGVLTGAHANAAPELRLRDVSQPVARLLDDTGLTGVLRPGPPTPRSADPTPHLAT